MSRTILALQAALLGLAITLSSPQPAIAQTAATPYRYNTPPGWVRAMDGDIESLTPQAEPAGSVQMMLLAPKAASGDFKSQFDQERVALESYWGLKAPHATPLQGGQAAVGQYAAYFASYDSDGGARYMGFMALGTPQQFALLVFVAGSHDAFNRLAPQATEVFKSLSIAAR
jgi:hypothetical protein